VPTVQWELIFGWLAAAIFVSRLMPQPWQLWRTKVTAGVAWLGVANAVVSTAGWLIYGLAVGNPILWVPSLVALVPELITLALVGVRPPDARQALLFTCWAAAVGLAYPLGGATLLGGVIGVGVLMGVLPHVVVALRSSWLAGVARRTWQIALVDGALWGAYSIWSKEPLTAFYGAVMVSGSAVVLWRLHVTGGRGARSGVPAAVVVGTHTNDV
jgi:uncharacterized protein with PQ loop repeat